MKKIRGGGNKSVLCIQRQSFRRASNSVCPTMVFCHFRRLKLLSWTICDNSLERPESRLSIDDRIFELHRNLYIGSNDLKQSKTVGWGGRPCLLHRGATETGKRASDKRQEGGKRGI